jgi:hypothetical protein
MMMSAQIEILHNAPNPTHFLLVVAEGYTSYSAFCDDVKPVINILMTEVEPYANFSERFLVVGRFAPSDEEGIGQEDAKNTEFEVYIDSDNVTQITIDGMNNLAEAAKKVEFNVFGFDEPFKGEDVWLNLQSPSHTRLIAVAANGNPIVEEGRATAHPAIRTWWIETLPFLIFLAKGGPIETKLNTLAHELGHCFGLGDEYEEPGDPSEFALYDDLEPEYPNITAAKTVEESGGTIRIDNVKWRHLMTLEERLKVKQGDPTYVVKKPQRPALTPDLSVNRPESAKVGLVEGGGLYWSGIYRSRKSCIMRGGPYLQLSAMVGSTKPNVTEMRQTYCQVCRHHIQGEISGHAISGIGRWSFKKLESQFTEDVMPRLVYSFRDYFDLTTLTSGEFEIFEADSAVAAARCAIMLLERGQYPNIRIDIWIGAPRTSVELNNLIIDPTFYYWYTTNEGSPLKYQTKDGIEKEIRQTDAQGGFVGNVVEMGRKLSEKRPVSGANLPSSILASVGYNWVLGAMSLYPNDIILSLESDVTPEELPELARDAWQRVQLELDGWCKYNEALSTGSETVDIGGTDVVWTELDKTFRPLRMDISLKSLKAGEV